MRHAAQNIVPYLNQGDTGPSMTISVVVNAPEIAVNIHLTDLNSFFSSEFLSRLFSIANPPVSFYWHFDLFIPVHAGYCPAWLRSWSH